MIRNAMTSELSYQRNDAIVYFTCSNISRHWELFLQNRSRKLFPQIVASMFVKLKRKLWECYWDILAWSFIVRNMVKMENLDVWPLSNWELVSHFFIFRPIADAICHTLFYKREMILERYAEVYSNQFTTGKSPFQLVQCSTVLNSKKL